MAVIRSLSNITTNHMAFENRTGGKYFNIHKGKFAIRVAEGTPGAVARVLEKGENAGKTVYEIYHDSFTGKLVGIRKKEGGKYGTSWEFDFQDGGEIYTLQLSYSNSYATNILKILPNVDLTKEMKVQPSQKIEDGKTKSSLFISQNGVTLKHAFTKENPNGMPDMEQITVSGKLQWDDSKRLAFLEEMVTRDILPKLSGAMPVTATQTAAGEDSEDDF